MSIQFRTEKSNFGHRRLAKEGHKVAKIFPHKATRFFNIQSGFSGRLGIFNFRLVKFSYICLVIFLAFYFKSICCTFVTFIQVQRKKAKAKIFSKKLSTKATKNYAERT